MKLILTKLENIVLTIITILPSLYPSFLLLLVRLGDNIVNLCDLYSYKVIGKLTGFLQLQEFNLDNLPVVSSTSSVWCSPSSLNEKLSIFSFRLQHYGLF
jgi:hypothetical protein